jgi:hypothetical protein
MDIFPNPASDFVQLKFPQAIGSSIELQIYNVSGQPMVNAAYSVHNNALSLNVQNFPAGVYFITAVIGNYRYTGKLVK